MAGQDDSSTKPDVADGVTPRSGVETTPEERAASIPAGRAEASGNRIADLTRRLDALEKRWPARGGPPSIPEPPTNVELLTPWLERLHQTTSDLARQQSDLESRFSALVNVVESADDGTVSLASAGPLEPLLPAPPEASVGRRLARFGIAALRAGRNAARQVWHSGVPRDVTVRIARDVEAPELTLALLSPTGAAPGSSNNPPEALRELAAFREWIEWNQDTGSFAIQDSCGTQKITGEASGIAGLAAASQADVVAHGFTRPGEVAAGTLETALHAMSVENLAFVHLKTAQGRDLLLARWSWAAIHGSLSAGGCLGLAADRLRAAPKASLVGKSVGLAGSAIPCLPATAAAALRGVDGRWLSSRYSPRPVRHERRLARTVAVRSKASRQEPGALAIVLSRPLGGGLDQLVTSILRHQRQQRPVVLAQLSNEGLSPAHPVAAWPSPLPTHAGATQAAVKPWPMSDFFDPADRPHALLQMLDRQRISQVLHIGPGDGFLDFDAVTNWASSVSAHGIYHLGIAHPARPGLLLEPPAGASQVALPLGLGIRRFELPEAYAARQRLGLPRDAIVACHLGDLGLDERPEDLLSIFAALRENENLWLLLAGRGPLAGTVDDIADFLGIERIRRGDFSPPEALAASDIALSVAESSPLPWGILSAAAHGIPLVLSSNDSRLQVLADGGYLHGAGAFKQAAESILELAQDETTRRRLGARAREIVESLEVPGWLDGLFDEP